jgi:hypothetical protein
MTSNALNVCSVRLFKSSLSSEGLLKTGITTEYLGGMNFKINKIAIGTNSLD